MMIKKKHCHLAFSLLAVFAAVLGTVDAAPHEATVSLFKTPPTIDGTIQPGEWDGAVKTIGYLSLNSNCLEKGMGAAYVGFTREKVYVALVTELPPDQKLIASKKFRDSELVFEDSFEIWLNPYRETEKGWEAGGTYFQTMGISNGTISDTRFTGKGAPDTGWNGNWTFENGIHTDVTEGPYWARRNGVWVAELSIPFAEVGWQGDPVGRSVGVLICRNFKRASGWKQPTWFPHTDAFVTWLNYPEIKLTEDAPSVQVEALGENVFSGELSLRARIHNPGPARKAQVKVKVTSSDMPGLDETRTVDLPANGAATYEYKVPAGRLHATAQHRLKLDVLSADGKTQYFDYSMRFKERGKFWLVRTGPNPAAALRLAYYPSYKFIRLAVNTDELEKEAGAVRSAAVTVTGPDEKQILKDTMTWEGAGGVREFDVGELPDGDYTVHVEMKHEGYERSFTREFTRTHFVWENNRLGETDRIYPPFEAIDLKDRELAVVLRRYGVGPLGLWDSVEAKGQDERSGYRELLAAPIALKVNDGQTLKGNGSFTATEPHAVVYEGKAEHPAVTVETKTITEYDGCQRVEMTLSPGGEKQELKKLYLDIPVKDEQAPLFHVSTAGLRSNPAGATPRGEGVVWDSSQFPDGEWYGNFKPYLWLGGESRGICWFADNDRNWELDVEGDTFAPCQEIIRRDGTLTLRINFIQKPVTIDEPRTIVFGLMASPAKPMPKDWRRVSFLRHWPAICWVGSTYWGAETMTETYPLNRDFSVLSKIQEARLNGDVANWNQWLQTWTARNLADYEPKGRKGLKAMHSLFTFCLNTARQAGRSAWMNVYWEEFHNVSRFHPETQVFGNEWSGGYGKGSVHPLTESYLDFQCWYGAEFIRRGVGLYFDNVFPKRTYDTLTTQAYRNDAGFLQPSANMWRHRRYLKRIWILHQQLAPAEGKPIMMTHMTNTHIVPYMVWNQSNLDLEWFYGPDPQQSKYPHDLLRAQSIGLQTGNIPLVLADTRNNSDAERTKFGTMFVHEIKIRYQEGSTKPMVAVLDFGYGRDDCRVYNYWDEDYPVSTSDDEHVKGILLERDGKLMLVLATWNGKRDAVEVGLDLDALGLNITRAVNAESNENLPLKQGKLNLELEPYAVRLVRFEQQP